MSLRQVSLREVLKAIILLTTAGLSGLVMPGLCWPADREKPNIIFILTDDHRWDALSKMGHPVVQTPNLDKLCSQGVHFANAFVTTSLCSPSRASFLTGQYAHTHGVKNNLTPWRNENVTFLEVLRKAGYDTAFIGKWHMPGELPKLRGVDHFITFTVQAGQGRYFNCPLIINGKPEPSRKSYITEELTDLALEFISRKRSNPFCLYLSHKAVHHQFLPPPELNHLYDGKDLPLPPEADSWVSLNPDMIYCGMLGPLEFHYRNYLEALHALDLQIGRVLKRIDEMGASDNTVVIYCGDNGFFWGEHRLLDKRWPYEESIRIPFVVRDPRTIKDPGRTANQMALNIDLAPTLLELAGLPVPANMEGQSLAPILRNPQTPGRKAWLYEYFKDFPYRVPQMNAVRTDRYKYIEYEGSMEDELFDLVLDPKEKRNLMDEPEGRQLIPKMQSLLQQLKKGAGL
ncbi:MAG: sulfatase [Pseudomonadota bacterium]